MDYEPPSNRREAPSPIVPRAPKPETSPKRRRLRLPRKLVIWLLVPMVVCALGIVAGVGVAAYIKMPQVETIDDFVPRLITEVTDRQGDIFQTYSREKRVLLEPGDLPELVQQAVVAVEDSEFFRHGGVDIKSIARAAWSNMRSGRRGEGASTLTMQLARALFLHREKTWKRKIEEAFLAVELEKRFSKQQILTMYCNLMNHGNGNYGVEAASRAYFAKPSSELTLPEAATLAGIPQRPNAHNMYRNPDLVVSRRNEVLGRMFAEGYIDKTAFDAAIATPLEVAPKRTEQILGPYFAEEVRRSLYDAYGAAGLYDRGMRVETTLDPLVQRASERALREGLARIDRRKGWRGPIRKLTEKEDPTTIELPSWVGLGALKHDTWYEGVVTKSSARNAQIRIGNETHTLDSSGIKWTRRSRVDTLIKTGDIAWFRLLPPASEGAISVLTLEQAPEFEGSVIVVESATGAVRGMVGGWSYDRNEFNRVTQAKRQIGSAFKPFVYGAALESGYTAADTVFDAPAVFTGANNTESYSPRNYYRRYYGVITLRRALEISANVSAVKILDLIGAEQVIDFAHRAGFTTDLSPYPSLALGAIDLSPMELAGAYATIANQGIHVQPYLVDRIIAHDGRVIEEHLPQAHKAMEPQIAYVLIRMLQGVVENGTARSIKNLDIAIAGKTGTTDNWTDAWFAGFTPQYTILAWVGYDKSRSLGRGHTGAEAALPIWRSVVEQGLADGWMTKGETFERPPGIIDQMIEYFSGRRVGPGAERLLKESFIEGTDPPETYDIEWAQVMQLPWYQQVPFYLPKEGERMPGQILDWGPVRRAWQEKRRGPAQAGGGR